MTMAFDAPAKKFAHLSRQNLRRKPDTDTCGAGLDWSKGLKGLPRVSRTSNTTLSGSLLTKVIEGEIIPRLLLAHRELRSSEACEDTAAELTSSDVFARLVLGSEAPDIVSHVQGLLDRGITLESILLNLLAPVARRLGELWEEDICTFTDVTLGLSRLHLVLHEIGHRNGAGRGPAPKRRAFFAPVPGEQHTFGISILEEFFLHAGWEATCDHAPSTVSILQTAATQSLDVIGFSVGCQELLDDLSDLIDKTRSVSLNRDVAILVGGGLFIDNQDLSARFGNATIVCDGVQAVQLAEQMVSRPRPSDEAGRIL